MRTRNGEEGHFKPIDEISPKFRRGVIRHSFSSDELETTLCYQIQAWQAAQNSGKLSDLALDTKQAMEDNSFVFEELRSFMARKKYCLKVMRDLFGPNFGRD